MFCIYFFLFFIASLEPFYKDFFLCFIHSFNYRYGHYKKMREAIDKYEGGLELFSRGYEKFGFIRR